MLNYPSFQLSFLQTYSRFLLLCCIMRENTTFAFVMQC